MLDMDDHHELWDPPANLIDKAKLPGMPRHGIGRGFKVAKEQIAALLTALELFQSGADDAQLPAMRRRLEQVAAALAGLPARYRLLVPVDGESLPLLEITVDQLALKRTALDVCRSLRKGEPPIHLSHGALHDGRLIVNPMHLTDDQTAILARRVREELSPRPA